MARASKMCRVTECVNLRPCPLPGHERKAWEGSKRRDNMLLKSGSREQKRAQAVLVKHETVCHVCDRPGSTQADHVIPLKPEARLPEHRHLPLSVVDHMDNMRPIHAECHRQKTQEEAERGAA